MEKGSSTPSPEEQSKIEKERVLSDVDLVKGGAEFKEGGRLEATGEQVEKARAEMQAEQKSESPEVKNLEELKKKAEEVGASPEDIKALDSKLEQARDGGEAYLAKKENECKEAERAKQELRRSIESGGSFTKKAENRTTRDMLIGGISMLGIMGLVGAELAGLRTGVDGAMLKMILGGSVGLGAVMVGAPIARIQNWLEKKKIKEDISQAGEKNEKAWDELSAAKKKLREQTKRK